jgi:5-methylcytosine-specific restriction protein A
MWWLKKEKEKNRSIFEERDKHQKFYKSNDWQRARLHILNDQPLCIVCLASGYTTPATVVDHIQPLRLNWSLRLTYSNLQSLCDVCHNKKSRQEQHQYYLHERNKKINDKMNDLDDFD